MVVLIGVLIGVKGSWTALVGSGAWEHLVAACRRIPPNTRKDAFRMR